MRAALSALMLCSSILLGGLAGCATPPPATDPDAVAEFRQTNDPFEPTNRVFYAVNDALDTVVLRPIALAYRYVVPSPVRLGVHNILANLSSPVLLADDLLQGKPRRAGGVIVRFVINTTVGLVGIDDIAAHYGFPAHDTDFGVTLALWGVPEGPFLFLPVLGPSDPRDATGFGVDVALDPFTWVGSGATVVNLDWARYGVSAVDARAGVLDELDSIKRSALDPYATLRSLYRQHRASLIQQDRTDTAGPTP